MYDFVIIHGSFGSPFENWSPWLFDELGKSGYDVLAPQLPTINQNYQNWENVLSSYDQFIDENTSIIAHSLGPAFVLDYLINKNKKVNNLYFAAPFYGLINIEEFDEVNKSFFIFNDLGQSCKYFNKAICLFSDNDPYVPINMSKDFSNKINATVQIISGGKHLNESAGFNSFNEMLNAIKKYG